MSDGDDLLDEVGALLREQSDHADDAEWAAWERLAAGEDDEALTDAERRAAFEPFDDATLDALTDVAAAALAGEAKPVAVEEAEAGVVSPETDAAPTAAEVVPLMARRRWWFVGGALAAAAVLLVFVWRPGPDASGVGEYTMTVTAGDQVLRGDPEAPPADATLAPGSRFELVLRPESSGPPPLVDAYLSQGGAREPWDVAVERAPGGAVRVAGTAADLFGERRGRWRVELELRAEPDAPATVFGADVALEADP